MACTSVACNAKPVVVVVVEGMGMVVVVYAGDELGKLSLLSTYNLLLYALHLHVKPGIRMNLYLVSYVVV